MVPARRNPRARPSYRLFGREGNEEENMATVAGRGERARRGTPKRLAAPANELSEEAIRLLAYRLYERRCESGVAGDAAEDWIQAEQLLLNDAPVNTNGK
jgi:hypothetical protein